MMFWLLVIIILSIIEILTINLVTIWYVASALIALIVSIFTDNFTIQVAVFVILGTILLLTTKKTLNKLLKDRRIKTNIDRIVGMKGIVLEEIKENKMGAVKVDGKVWTAYADKDIKVDSIVKILEINSTKIKVEEE